MYSVASCYFEPERVVAFEIDPDAISIAEANLEHYELTDDVKIVNLDILKEFGPDSTSEHIGTFDTILMNPPFGTKNNEGIDMLLLKAATRALKSGGQLFSLHKASTRQYIEKYM
jgi:rRNA N6-adenosine-methyltransferase METTL5